MSGQLYPVVPSKSEILISPNPALDRILVALPTDREQIESVRIIEPASGRLCKSFSDDLPGQKIQDILLDISDLPEGIYVIVIRTNNRLISQKFIKR